jgi:hypothetical protein
MATIEATAGDANANCYVTLGEFTLYVDERPNAEEIIEASAAGEPEQVRALIAATYRLDQEAFRGARLTTAQSLKWPRIEAFDDDRVELDGVPRIVKHATMELALAMLQSDQLSDSGLEAFAEVRLGPLSATPRMGTKAGELPANVKRLLRPVLSRYGAQGRTDLA